MAAQDRKTSGADNVMVYNNIVVLILEDLETDHEKRKEKKIKRKNHSATVYINLGVFPDCAKSFVDLDHTL